MNGLRWYVARRLQGPGHSLLAPAICRVASCVVIASLCAAFFTPARGATLRGRVVDLAGDPVAWVSIDARHGVGPWRFFTYSREDGTFLVDVPEPGDLRLKRLGYRESITPFSMADSAVAMEIRLHPLPRPVEGVEVTALRRPGTSTDLSVPMVRMRSRELRDRAASMPSIVNQLRQTPEVSTIGRDEYNAAPAIRGLARFRTVLFLDGARVQSDREIGPSAGFVDPASLQSVEIVRGPGSVLYGSDAIGGVVLMRSDDADGGAWVETGWSSVNEAVRSVGVASVPIAAARVSVSAAHASAGDYALPGNARSGVASRRAENSGFQRTTARARLVSGGFEATTFYSLGNDIGRPAREAERFTVPSEEHVLATARFRHQGERRTTEAHVYAHPVAWNAVVEEPTEAGIRHQDRTYRSLDWGALLTRAAPGARGTWIAGVQVDARARVRIHRRLVDRDSSGAILTDRLDRWVDGASVGQGGLFAHGMLRTGATRWNAGARADVVWREGSSRDVRRVIPTGGGGVSADLSPRLLVHANLASAYREPTVTELFFAGRRPAGYIEGNPSLKPERSYQADAGARWNLGAVVASLSSYGIFIEDYIGARVRAVGAGSAVDTLRYENAARGFLVGGSVGFAATRPWRGFTAGVFLDAMRGTDGDGTTLPDLSPVRGRLELAWSRGRASGEFVWRGAAAHDRVGSGERPVPGYGVLDAGGLIPLGPVQVRIRVENVFDQEFYERPDPASYPSPGRGVAVAFRWSER